MVKLQSYFFHPTFLPLSLSLSRSVYKIFSKKVIQARIHFAILNNNVFKAGSLIFRSLVIFNWALKKQIYLRNLQKNVISLSLNSFIDNFFGKFRFNLTIWQILNY